jgi:hypothetical protein
LTLAAAAALATVADAGTECGKPTADPIFCAGPFAYPYITGAGTLAPPAPEDA